MRTPEKPPASFSLVARLRQMLWAILFLPLAAGVGFFVLYSAPALQERALRDLTAVLSLERQFIDDWLAQRKAEIMFIAQDPRTLKYSSSELRRFFEGILRAAPGFDDIAFANEKGRTVCDTRYPVGLDISDRAYFRRTRNTRDVLLSQMVTSRQTGRRIVTVSAPVYDAQGRFCGVIYGAVDLLTFDKLVQTLQMESTGRTYLTQADGVVVSPREDIDDLRRGDVIYERALQKNQSFEPYTNARGRLVVGAFQWANEGRWLLVAEKRVSKILALHAVILGVPFLGAMVVLFVFGPMMLRLARSLRAPMLRLERHARSIQAGDFSMPCDPTVLPGEPEEIRRLNAAYCLMVGRVRKALEDLRESSFTDALTGAANRKRLFDGGPRLLSAASRAGQPVSALMLDLDHFKAVNDTYGHAAGDAVLAAFARQVSAMLRQSDILARYGGEEFVVLAPNSGLAAGRELAERIRAAVAALRVPVEGGELRFTVSIGASSLGPAQAGPSGESGALEALLARADAALYDAKAAGRNRVEVLPFTPKSEA